MEIFAASGINFFFLPCSQCRDVRCSNFVMLKSSISLSMKFADDDGKNYLQNFITDYFNLSDICLKKFNINMK